MSERIDIDSLARECGGTHKLSLGVYQFYKDELTAYTRAVMEHVAMICGSHGIDTGHTECQGCGEELAAAIREMMP